MSEPRKNVPVEDAGAAPADRNDIQVWELRGMSWKTAAEAGASLARLHPQVLAKAEESIRWYLHKARSKRRWARLLRLGTIGMVFLSSLLPLLSQLVRGAGGALLIPPGWASVPMIVAAGLIGLDKYFGCSTGWIRFVSAGLRLQKYLTDFQIEWQAGVARWKKAGVPNAEEVQSMLGCARSLLGQVDDVVLEETGNWAAEFASVLKAMEASAKASAEGAKPALPAVRPRAES